MATYVLTDEEDLNSIADAIRTKNGNENAKYTPSEMAPAILEIKGGGIAELPDNLVYMEEEGEEVTLHSEAVLKSGDIMTGALTLHGDPTENLHAATKQYVDNTINNYSMFELLWTNSNPAIDFAGQTITVPESVNYSSFMIEFRVSTSSGNIGFYFERSIHEGSAVNCHYGVPYSNGSTWSASIITRKVTISDTNFIFAGCYQYTNGSSSPSSQNGLLIPYKIYGIK